MNILAYYTIDEQPATGLTPAVTVVEVPAGTVVLDGVSLLAVPNASGWYSYDFTSYDEAKEYVITADAGVDTVDDRYLVNVSGLVAVAPDSIAEAVWSYERP